MTMDATFETIGLEVPSEKAINFLAERAENQGEASQLSRRGAVLAWPLLEARRGPRSLDGALRIRHRRRFLRELPSRFSRALHATNCALGVD